VRDDGLRQLRRTVLKRDCWRSSDITAGTLLGNVNVILDTRTPLCKLLDASVELDT